MPSIPEYYSRENSLTPSSTGASAWEQAGRRIGPLYNEAATFREREGRLAAEAQREKMWPFDILRLYQIQATEQAKVAAAATAASSSGFRVVSRPGGATGNASDFDTPRYLTDGWTPGYDGVGQVSRGAAAIGQALADGGQALARQTAGRPPAPNASGGGGADDYTLEQGNFVSASYQRRIDAENRVNDAKALNRYGTDLSDYYQQYYGYQPVPAGNMDPSQGTAGNPVSNTGTYIPRTPTGGYGGYSTPSYDDSTGGWFSGLSRSNTGITPDQWGVMD